MHAVILAAGRNERLWGAVPPFMKPFIEIDGESLMETHLREATDRSNRVVVVGSVENADKIRPLLTDDSRLVIQPSPVGPGDALMRGLEACDDAYALVICADNIIPRAVYDEMLGPAHARANGFTVVTTVVEGEDAARFTRYTSDNRWTEGPLNDLPRNSSGYQCWLGPVLIPREAALKHLHSQVGVYRDMRIAPTLDALERINRSRRVRAEDVIDIGTMQALQEAVLR